MYQCEVRPRSGHERALRLAIEQPGSPIIRSSFLSNVSFQLLAFYTNRRARCGALALLTACVVSVLSGCGGVSFSPSSTSTAATLTMISCGVQSLTGAQTKTCSVYLSASATQSTPVSLTSSNAALKLPASVVVEAGQKTAAFSAVTEAVTKSVSVTITGLAQGVTETDVLTLNPVPNAPPATPVATLSSVACGKQSLTGPMSVACSVSLSQTATSETVVTLSSSSSALKVPLAVNVATGKTSASFDATASAVSTTQKVNLTATSDSVTESDTIILYPVASPNPAPVATLDGLSCGTQSLTGAQTKTCTVSLSAAATSQLVVTLSSSSSALRAPASVTVAAGGTSATFSVATSAVSASQKATLTATAEGVSQTDVITLYPATAAPTLSKVACGSQTLTVPATETCTVYLSATAASPTVVGLSTSNIVLQVPASVTVAAGSTSVNFSAKALTVLTTELVTLTATWNGVSQKDVLQLQGTTSSQPSNAPPEVQLSWDAPNSSSDPVAGYHVYRATGSSSNYSMLSTLDTQTTYTDTTVQSGSTYDYIVKTVATNGVESGPSNPVSVTIP